MGGQPGPLYDSIKTLTPSKAAFGLGLKCTHSPRGRILEAAWNSPSKAAFGFQKPPGDGPWGPSMGGRNKGPGRQPYRDPYSIKDRLRSLIIMQPQVPRTHYRGGKDFSNRNRLSVSKTAFTTDGWGYLEGRLTPPGGLYKAWRRPLEGVFATTLATRGCHGRVLQGHLTFLWVTGVLGKEGKERTPSASAEGTDGRQDPAMAPRETTTPRTRGGEGGGRKKKRRRHRACAVLKPRIW